MKKVKTVVLNDSYINYLDQLSIVRDEFETKTLRGSNKELYKILSDVYSLFIEIDSNKSKYDILKLKIALKDRGFKIQNNTPVLTLLIRYVFNSDRTRSYNYNRVISSAHQREISPGKLSDFIEEEGGIEECKKRFVRDPEVIRKSENKNDEIQYVLNNFDTLDSFETIELGKTQLETKENTKLIITVGRLSSDGKSVELIEIVNSMNLALEKKIIKMVSSKLYSKIENSRVQTEQTLEKVSG